MYIQSIIYEGRSYIGFEFLRVELEDNEGIIAYELNLTDKNLKSKAFFFHGTGKCKDCTSNEVIVNGKIFDIVSLFNWLNNYEDTIFNLCHTVVEDLDSDGTWNNIFICLLARPIDLEFRNTLRIEVVPKPDDDMCIVVEEICDTFIIEITGLYRSLLDFGSNPKGYYLRNIKGTDNAIKVSIVNIELFKKLKQENQKLIAKLRFANLPPYYGKFIDT